MSNLLIAVDLAKDVFELAVARPSGKVVERKRLTRAQFERFWEMREPCSVVMEACSSAPLWARHLLSLGFEVSLLPPRHVRPYRQRGKTDRIDCDALLEAARSPRIKAVAIKSRDQQAILALHRVREQWKSTRTMRINGMRGVLREFGVTAPAAQPSSWSGCRSCSSIIATGCRSACVGSSSPSGQWPTSSRRICVRSNRRSKRSPSRSP